MQNLGIDLKLLIAQLINFGLFFYIFKKFIAEPFGKYIDSEKAKDTEREKYLADAKTERDRIDEQAIKIRAEIKKESNKLIEETKEAASKLKEKILDEARIETEEIKEKAKKIMEDERKALYKDFQDKVVELSLMIVNKTFKDVLTDDIKKKITERLLKNLPRLKSTNHEN